MARSAKTERFRSLIARQRVAPRIWDYSYLYLRNNARIFRRFETLVAGQSAGRASRCDILDVGCGFKPWESGFAAPAVRYIGVDHDREMSSADALASADALPFAEDSFDALIYSEVLEHAADLVNALKEMRRVARDGALVYISSPFVFPEHGVPHDFQRLSRYFYLTAFGEEEIVALAESNTSAATAFASFNLVLESSPFALLTGLKQVVYSGVNTVAWLVDVVASALIRLLPPGRRAIFGAMPLGYAVIVRIRK